MAGIMELMLGTIVVLIVVLVVSIIKLSRKPSKKKETTKPKPVKEEPIVHKVVKAPEKNITNPSNNSPMKTIIWIAAIAFLVFVPLIPATKTEPLSYMVLGEDQCTKKGYGLFTDVYAIYGIRMQNTDKQGGYFTVHLTLSYAGKSSTKTETVYLASKQIGNPIVKDYAIGALDTLNRCSYSVESPTVVKKQFVSLLQKITGN